MVGFEEKTAVLPSPINSILNKVPGILDREKFPEELAIVFEANICRLLQELYTSRMVGNEEDYQVVRLAWQSLVEEVFEFGKERAVFDVRGLSFGVLTAAANHNGRNGSTGKV